MGALRVRGGAPKQPDKKARQPHLCSRQANLMRCTMCGGWYCYRCGRPLTLKQWQIGPKWLTHGSITYGCRCVVTNREGRSNDDFPGIEGDLFGLPGHWNVEQWM